MQQVFQKSQRRLLILNHVISKLIQFHALIKRLGMNECYIPFVTARKTSQRNDSYVFDPKNSPPQTTRLVKHF